MQGTEGPKELQVDLDAAVGEFGFIDTRVSLSTEFCG